MINQKEYDVVIIGGGPAGISAAVSLKNNGVDSVLIMDREPVIGGIVRHCGHRSFGLFEFKRLLTGAEYAQKLRKSAEDAKVDIAVKTTVTKYSQDGVVSYISPDGAGEVKGKRVLITTGLRETPRSARLVTGKRPMGIMTTAAYQSMLYLEDNIPCKKPVIVGSEIVAFSALMTAKHFKIKPVAMVEENSKLSLLPRPLDLAVPILGAPVYLNTKVIDIRGDERVESVLIKNNDGETKELICDAVIFTGKFVSHSTLVRFSHLELNLDTTSPVIDQYGRCSDKTYYATGNIIMPLKTGGKCWRLGRGIGKTIANDLNGLL